MALAALALLAGTGVVNAYSEVGSIEALWETAYGRLVTLKSALLVPLLGLGYLNRRYALAARAEPGPSRGAERFLTIVILELVVMALIVSVIAVLIDEAPPRTAAGR